MSLIGNPDTPASYVADYMQACVGMFGIPAGGFTSDIETYGAATSYDVESLYAAMLNSSIGRAIYAPGSSNESFATKLVDKVGGGLLSAADKAAAVDEVQALLDGGLSHAATAMAVVEFVAGLETSDETYGAVAQQFQNRIEIANYYTFSTNAPSTTLGTLTAVLSVVTNTTDVSNPEEVLEDNDEVVTGQTFTLTTGTDIINTTTHLLNSGASSLSYYAGAGNDEFLASGGTLDNTDAINGGGGTDTLNAGFTANSQVIKPSLTSIENVVATITATNTKAFTLDANNNADIQVLTIKDAGADSMSSSDELITVNNLNRATTFGIDGGTASSGNTASEITVNFKDAAAADTQKVAISNGGKTAVLTLSTAETVEITATGTGTKANTIGSLAATAAKTLNIKGDGKLTIAASDLAATVTVDATANNGGVDFTAEGTTTLTFKGGAGNDRLVIAPAELTSADSVDMGGGTNTLALTTITKLEQGTTTGTDITATEMTAIKAAKNVQVIEGTADAVTVADFADFTQSTIKLSGDLSAGLAVNGVETGDKLVVTKSNTAFNGDAITISGALPNQTAEIQIGGAASVAINATDAGANNNALVATSGVSTVKINSTTTAASTTGIANSFGLAATTTATHTVNNDSAGSFILTGNVDFTIASGNTAGFVNAVDFNATDFTGKLTLAGSANADVIKGGSGNDTITGLGGADQITLGGGNDKVVYTNIDQSVAAAKDVIKDFNTSGNDKIDLSALTNAELSTAVLANVQSAVNALVTGSTLTDALNAAANTAGTNNAVMWFEFGGNTYVYREITGSGTTYTATDLVIELTGTGLNLGYVNDFILS